jgi:hypothetical protein
VQFAVKRLLQLLTEDAWADHTYETFCNTEELCYDLSQTCSSGRASPSLFATQILEACIRALRRCTMEAPQGARFILKESLFRRLFTNIQKGIKEILPVSNFNENMLNFIKGNRINVVLVGRDL